MAVLYQDIEIILRAELNKFLEVGRGHGGLGSMVCSHEGRESFGPPTEWRKEGDVRTKAIVLAAPPGTVHSDHLDTLVRLYASLADDMERRSFQHILARHLSKDSPYVDIAYFAVWGLHKIGQLPVALGLVSVSLRDAGGLVVDDVLRLLDTLLRLESKGFSVGDLDAVEQFTTRIPGDHRRLKERLAEARLELLRNRLEGVNPAVNEDREKAVRLWSEEFHSEEFGRMVRRIEEMFESGAMDATQFATCMDRIRALLVEVCRQIAARVVELRGQGNVELGKDHAVFDYLTRKDVSILTTREKGLVAALYGLCSEEGAHRIISEREYARLTKNMAYELFLLLLEKLQVLRKAV